MWRSVPCLSVAANDTAGSCHERSCIGPSGPSTCTANTTPVVEGWLVLQEMMPGGGTVSSSRWKAQRAHFQSSLGSGVFSLRKGIEIQCALGVQLVCFLKTGFTAFESSIERVAFPSTK